MNLALFDLDKTLIPIDSDHAWGEFLVRTGIVDSLAFKQANDRFYADYVAGTLNIDEYLRFALSPMANKPLATVNAWHEEFMHTVIKPVIQPVALDLVQKHQTNGDLCAIVTATNSFVTTPIAKAFGIQHLIASTCDTLPDGRIAGTSTGTPSFGEGKIVRVDSWLASLNLTFENFEKTWFYSDSRNDLPLLRKVSHPVATNPDNVLLAEAIAKNWQRLELFAS
jgi:HAD superfamily hydrolase (TIGR01490 family)